MEHWNGCFYRFIDIIDAIEVIDIIVYKVVEMAVPVFRCTREVIKNFELRMDNL